MPEGTYRHEPKENFYGYIIYPQSTEYKTVAPYEVFSAGEYEVAAVPSNHIPHEPSYVYAVKKGGKSLLYATDTAPLFPEVYDFFARRGYKFDCVICDGTYGNLNFDEGHMNFADCENMRQKLQKLGLISQECKFIVTHVSHNAARSLSELEKSIPQGFISAFDGLEICV